MVLGRGHRVEHFHRPPAGVTLRVLHCIYDDTQNPWVAGGGAVRVLELYRRLTGPVRATVATGNFPGARDEVIDGVAYRRLGARAPYAWSRLSYAAAASRLLRTGAYDAAVFDFSAYTPIRVPAHRRVGITVHHLTGPTARDRWGRVIGAGLARWERRTIRRATRLSATSAATHALLHDLAPDIPIDRVYAGVPDDLFDAPRTPEPFLLYFGRLDVLQKGLDTLLNACSLMLRARPDLELRIAGRGKDSATVAGIVRRLGIAERVRLLGAVSAGVPRALFAGAAVQLMPSRFEGFGMVAAEAMAAGVPLIAAAAGSLPEVVDAPNGGILVPPDDAAALAAATLRLLDEPEERARLSRSARASAQRFRWNHVVAQHLGFLERIAHSPSNA